MTNIVNVSLLLSYAKTNQQCDKIKTFVYLKTFWLFNA